MNVAETFRSPFFHGKLKLSATFSVCGFQEEGNIIHWVAWFGRGCASFFLPERSGDLQVSILVWKAEAFRYVLS
jgi:hypothetical protein